MPSHKAKTSWGFGGPLFDFLRSPIQTFKNDPSREAMEDALSVPRKADEERENPKRARLMAEAQTLHHTYSTTVRSSERNTQNGQTTGVENEHSTAEKELKKVLDKIIALDGKKPAGPLERLLHNISLAIREMYYAIVNFIVNFFSRDKTLRVGVPPLEKKLEYADVLRELEIRATLDYRYRQEVEMTPMKKAADTNKPTETSQAAVPIPAGRRMRETRHANVAPQEERVEKTDMSHTRGDANQAGNPSWINSNNQEDAHVAREDAHVAREDAPAGRGEKNDGLAGR